MSRDPSVVISANLLMAKRVFDVMAAAVAVVLLSPVFVVVPLLIKLTSPGPVFFHQTRIGLCGKAFRIFKFRTMMEHDENGAAKITVGEDGRITWLGRLLRKSKLDELPQLLNVLRGEMSLIGPRPEVPEYVEKYSPDDRRVVLSVRPGLSDFASIRFYNESEILAAQPNPHAYYEQKLLPDKLRYGRFYVRRAGVCLDLKLILWTILAVLGWTPRSFRPKRPIE